VMKTNHRGTEAQRRMRIIISSLCLCASVVSPASAAPSVTHLFPAGGQRGTTVEVTAAGTFDRWPVKVWVSGKGVTAEAAKEMGKFRVTVAADAVPGVYWLRPHDDTGGGNLRPFVVGTLPEAAEAEPNDEPGRPQPLDSGVVANGRLAKNGDVDCFAVGLKKGQTLVAAVEANAALRSPMDGVLQVLSAGGFVLAQSNDARDLDPRLAFAVPADGTYVVRVFAFPATPDSGIRFAGGDAFVYRLTVTTSGFADFPLPLAVERDKPAAVALAGWNLPESALAVPVRPDDPEADDAVVSPPGVANPVRVRVEPHPTFDATGPAAVPTPLRPPITVTARVGKPGGAARFTVRGEKGKPLSARVEARPFGLPLTPVVRVADASGKPLARGEPGKPNEDTTVKFTPPADGDYTVEVRDLHGHGGERFAFLIRVEPDAPDFALGVAADRLTVAPGKPADVTVTVARSGGFDKEIELSAVGLPAGVTASGKPGSGKTLTLRLTAEKSGAAGPVRIVGRPKGAAGPCRVARATIGDFGVTTPDIWVTAAGGTPPGRPAPPKGR
jgi:hypothetical protein